MAGDDETHEIRDALEVFATSSEALDALEAARRIRVSAEALELDAVRSARQAGISWSKIGAKYGLTKQGAQQRFAKIRKEGS